MPEIHFDRYYRYQALTDLLNAFAAEYPDLVSVQSIGKSYEGRDIWLVTVTNTETGPAEEKPALWIDANIHATEVSPGTAALYLINKLTTEYGTDEQITGVLDTRAFYIVPRVNPDGAEWALADVPKVIRSSTRPHPFDEEPLPGFEREDVDGDGRMLMMRIKDANGPYKPHPDEPRLLVRREPDEYGGEYYRVLPEGTIEDYDGVTIRTRRIKEGLDLNRNFPSHWRGEDEQSGAGPYPTSEPEVHALVEFIARHKNITGGLTFHTFSGVLLRPYGTQPDDSMPAEDLQVYKTIGKKGTDITGYPNISVFHDFKYHPKQVITGVFDDWLYDQLGIYGWTVEIWSVQAQSGVEITEKWIDWYREHPIEDDLKILKWSEEQLDGAAYVDWYEFDHPQLGKVELGGWDHLNVWRNPPPKFLEKEIAPFSDWAIYHLMISPRLELQSWRVSNIGGDNYQVRVVVQNTGWLPSYVSKQALAKKAVRDVVAEIELPDGALLIQGESRQEIGQLEGRAYTPSALTVWGNAADTSDRTKVEWTIKAPQGGEVKVTVKHERAGVIRETIPLE